jgi:hypothetical protein
VTGPKLLITVAIMPAKARMFPGEPSVEPVRYFPTVAPNSAAGFAATPMPEGGTRQ